MIKEYDKIITKVNKHGFKKGSIGIVCSIYEDGLACEVEILDDENYPISVETYELTEIELLENEEK